MGEVQNLNPKILIVDDNHKFLSEMKVTLSTDFNIVTAASAQIAMALMTTEAFDLVLLDYEMPDITGLEFLKILSTVMAMFLLLCSLVKVTVIQLFRQCNLGLVIL